MSGAEIGVCALGFAIVSILCILTAFAFKSITETSEIDRQKMLIMTDMLRTEIHTIQKLSEDLRESYDRVMAASNSTAYQTVKHFEQQRANGKRSHTNVEMITL